MPVPVTAEPPVGAQVPATMPGAHTVCPRCATAYDARLVQHRCPVCRTTAPGAPARRRGLGDDDRLLLIVALATLANLLVLGVLAAGLLH